MVPAIVGAAQVIQRPGSWSDPADASGPIELMVEAAVAAGQDAGAPELLAKVGWIGVVAGAWRAHDPGRLVAERIGASGAATALSSHSGSSPQEVLGIAAERISRGQLDVALVVGGEAAWSSRQIEKSGAEPSWTVDPGEGTPETFGALPPGIAKDSATLGAPANAYALFEDSRRASIGATFDDHRDHIARLCERFSAVAATNPYAWDRVAHSAAAIRDATPDNRMIAYPYTKAMVANNGVDMASAVLLCSAELARSLGVALDRMIFPHVVTSTHETWQVVNRDVLHRAPGIAAGAGAALRHSGISVDDIAHVDLYACFPSVVQMSIEAIGLDASRPLTVTGGLAFAGAPLSNSSGQAIAAMVPLLREGGYGFVHANGGFATKHAFGVYANHPPREFARLDCQDLVDERSREALDDDWAGDVTVEAATVAFGRDGPTKVLSTVLSDDGRRAYATSDDPALIEGAQREGLAGVAGRRRADGMLEA